MREDLPSGIVSFLFTARRPGRGESVRALELAAAVEALWRSLDTELHVSLWDKLLERYLGRARAAADADADVARARGLALALDDAVALPLDE